MNKLGKLLTLTIIATSLSSCGLFGPSYKKPDSDAPKTWASKDSGAKIDDSINLPDMAWWKKFNDPVLNDLIAKALKNNNDIQTAIGNIIQAAGILETTHMGWVPTMTGMVTYTTSGPLFNNGSGSGIPSIGGSGATSGFSPGYSENYGAGFQPSYNLNIFQQIKAQDRDSANLLSTLIY
jgi:outer membrane protein, multidrug efflux system